jgi:putative Holliday junction resolvase
MSEATAKRGRVLGIDYGERRLGLAISDETRTLASGLGVYTRRSTEADLKYLQELVARERIEKIVLGLPLNMDGSQGFKAQEALAFKEQLEAQLKLPVELIDERLTTQEAERVLLEADLSRRRRKEMRDRLAAVLILQRYLDAQRATGP